MFKPLKKCYFTRRRGNDREGKRPTLKGPPKVKVFVRVLLSLTQMRYFKVVTARKKKKKQKERPIIC